MSLKMSDVSKLVCLEKFDEYAVIRFNKPERKNAITPEMQILFRSHLESLAYDDHVKFVVITGTGEYFTSGADFLNETAATQDRSENARRQGLECFRLLAQTIIQFPKPIIAAVNGPAIGMGVTLLGLMDVVYCADTSTFFTPFSQLGLTPEGCSSYTFPRIMGNSVANEVLLFNRKLNAEEAFQVGFVSQIFPKKTFWQEIQKKIDEFVENPLNSYIYGKQLIRKNDLDTLLAVNNRECERLVERYGSEDVMEQAMKFVMKRQKIREQRKAKL